jgi:hypothetical protein
MEETSESQREKEILSRDYCRYSSLKMMFESWKMIPDKRPESFIEPIFGCLREISMMRRNKINIYFNNPENSPLDMPLGGSLIAEGLPSEEHINEDKKSPLDLQDELFSRFSEYLDGKHYSLEEQKKPRINGIKMTVSEESVLKRPFSTEIYFKPKIMMLNKDCLDDEKYILILTDEYPPFYQNSENPEFSARYYKIGWKPCKRHDSEKPLEARVLFHKAPAALIFCENDSIFGKKPEKLRAILEKYGGAKRLGR